MKRMGLVIKVRPEKIAEYRRLHAAVWPEVLALLSDCNVTNYSIFIREPENLLFAYWEYTGSAFEADMAKMEASPHLVRWKQICDPCQEPLATRNAAEWWAGMVQIFYHA